MKPSLLFHNLLHYNHALHTVIAVGDRSSWYLLSRQIHCIIETDMYSYQLTIAYFRYSKNIVYFSGKIKKIKDVLRKLGEFLGFLFSPLLIGISRVYSGILLSLFFFFFFLWNNISQISSAFSTLYVSVCTACDVYMEAENVCSCKTVTHRF